jgi:hypothetical protein
MRSATKTPPRLSSRQTIQVVVTPTTSVPLVPLAILLQVLSVHLCSSPSTLLTIQGDWEDIESDNGSPRRHEGGGIDLSEHFQRTVSISGSVSERLIDSEFSYSSANEAKRGPWSEVAGTGSWHTGSATARSASSSFNPNKYGNPSAPSMSGSMHSFNSSIVEQSQSGSERVETKNGFAKIKAYVSSHIVVLQI